MIDLIKSRTSVKKYLDKPVPQELLDKILEAGTFAPTGRNYQSPIIIAITNKEIRDKLSKLNAEIMGVKNIDPFYNAPVVLVVLASKEFPTHVYDGSLVMQNLMLAAHSLGLGSCWIHRAKEEFEKPLGKEILSMLNIQGEYEGIGHCILGYPDGEAPTPKPRKENYIYYLK